MKRFYIGLVVTFSVYALTLIVYFLKGDLFNIPLELIGTSADPHTFMTTQEITKAESLSRIRSLAYFLSTPLQMGVLVGVTRNCGRFRRVAERLFRASFLQIVALCFYLPCLWTCSCCRSIIFCSKSIRPTGCPTETLASVLE